MARPFTATDDQILNAARKVISRRGPDGFSIAEVASEVGLSRAAIILRFKSTHALKLASLTHMVQKFANAIAELPSTPSGDNLLRLAAFIGSYVRSRESSAKFFARFSANVQDRELAELETKRGDLLHKAVANVMPPVAIDHASAVLAFSAHLSGSILAWLARDDNDSRGYLVARTKEWLKLANVPFSEQVAEELMTPAPPAAETAPTRTKSPRSKTTGTAKRARARSKAAADR
jgi:TetR/AcrR family macrolide resistance operon transcriptional repressor